MLFKRCMAGESAAPVLYITVKRAVQQSTVWHSTVAPSQWEDSARLSAAAAAVAAAGAVAPIYCNYLSPLKEPATVGLL